MKTPSSLPKRPIGYALTNLLAPLAVFSIFAVVGVIAVNKQGDAARELELREQIKSLNSAIQTYKSRGGSLDGASTPAEVIAKIKAVVLSQHDLESGSGEPLIDLRLALVSLPADQVGTSKPRAIWNQTLRRFEYAESGADGIAEFIFTDAAIPTTSTQTDPGELSAILGGEEVKWSWEEPDQSESESGAEEVPQLAPPIFTVPGGN